MKEKRQIEYNGLVHMKSTLETPKQTRGCEEKGMEEALQAVKNLGFPAGFPSPDLRIIDCSTTADVVDHPVESPPWQIMK